MADIDRHVVVDDHGSNAGVWIVVALLLVIVLALLFLWPGWLLPADTDPDVINIERQEEPSGQDSQDTDVDVIVPDGSEETTP